MLGSNNLLSRPSIEMNTTLEFLIKNEKTLNKWYMRKRYPPKNTKGHSINKEKLSICLYLKIDIQ